MLRREFLGAMTTAPLLSLVTITDNTTQPNGFKTYRDNILKELWKKYGEYSIGWQHLKQSGCGFAFLVDNDKYYIEPDNVEYGESYLPKLPPQKQYHVVLPSLKRFNLFYQPLWFPLQPLDKLKDVKSITEDNSKPNFVYFLEYNNHYNVVAIYE